MHLTLNTHGFVSLSAIKNQTIPYGETAPTEHGDPSSKATTSCYSKAPTLTKRETWCGPAVWQWATRRHGLSYVRVANLVDAVASAAGRCGWHHTAPLGGST